MGIFEMFAPGCVVSAYVHILADYVTLTFVNKPAEKLITCHAAPLAKAFKRRRLE